MPEAKKIWDGILTLVLAVALSLIVRTYLAEARWIPSTSMLPTLKVGDRLLIDKISMKFNGINHGDIIVFHAPPSSGMNEDMIKRVVGLPGDTVSIKKGTVYINGNPLDEPYELEKPKDDFKPFTVPGNSIFVMGDNRNNSFDSRFWGVVPEELIIGRALACYYPFSNAAIFKIQGSLKPAS
ncbi:MAG: Signal peptidase I T [Pelotomaculum sp. PtaU1.Bin035]|nr:MAG: Signal peptidase I T [Pelotomaculum sp. PtaU1.Bin035]